MGSTAVNKARLSEMGALTWLRSGHRGMSIAYSRGQELLGHVLNSARLRTEPPGSLAVSWAESQSATSPRVPPESYPNLDGTAPNTRTQSTVDSKFLAGTVG